MSHLVLTGIGNPHEVVELAATPKLIPGPGEVLVDMTAAVINGSDFMQAMGVYGVQPPLPSLIGGEGIGTVSAVGADVEASLVGQRVMILPNYEQGTWAHQLVTKAVNVLPVDNDGDPLQQAMLGINPPTADLIVRAASARPGDWIAQTGANSAVARYVLGLARVQGLQTLNIVRRPEAVDQVTALGGTAVLVEDDPDLPEKAATILQGQHLQIVLDGVGGPGVPALAAHLKHGGQILTYAGVPGRLTSVFAPYLAFNRVTVAGFWVYNWFQTATRQDIEGTYARLADLVASGDLHVPVEATYKLTEYKAAFTHAQQGKATGKVLFTFD
ncbi:zinc-dependent alcohol dehydrogenase family protein [Kineococcus sp. R86509]|uniref:zinc-dependent alcohol dehydrogenase family protein n=1 Tax=Kineococcus sp. R86509 TaxID=3093851 RepID=UPI0036D3EA7A